MKVLITGGSGFIGSNAASRFLQRGDEVVLFDNLSRRGAETNLKWLWPQVRAIFVNGDVRDAAATAEVFREHADASLVLHLAAQVAVTTSLAEPRLDFETNVLGTLNVLEGARVAECHAPIIYSSSNKVYGQLSDLEVAANNGHCALASLERGVSEDRNLDFHSPYGCSKGAADQYVRDYHRIYGLNTVVMRQSCIYGPRQFGVEDQGWVAWFAIAAECDRSITIYGDGRQVRDILYVNDLVDAFEAAAANIERTAGKVYNIGGGPENAVSLLDVLGVIQKRRGRRICYRTAALRPGDQLVYISDIRRARHDFGWNPRIDWQTGLQLLADWVAENRNELE
jgi:CDP-paratose 2-epimerase